MIHEDTRGGVEGGREMLNLLKDGEGENGDVA